MLTALVIWIFSGIMSGIIYLLWVWNKDQVITVRDLYLFGFCVLLGVSGIAIEFIIVLSTLYDNLINLMRRNSDKVVIGSKGTASEGGKESASESN